MNQESKINKVMSGKKKITASLFLPIIAVVVNTFVVNPETAKTLNDLVAMYLPTLFVMVSGWFYTVNEASVDRERAKVKTEVEKTKQLEIQKAELPLLPKPKTINFKAFTEEVLERVETDEMGRPKGISLYSAIIDEGKQWEVELLQDVWEYAQLVVDAAEKKFEAIHGFDINAPDLQEILRTIGKCPYSTVDAFCAYEGNRVALTDVRNARRDRDATYNLIELDSTNYWKSNYDTTLYGIFTSARRLVANIKMKGG